MKRILFTIGWLYIVIFISAFLVSIYLQELFPKEEWDGQLYIFRGVERETIIKRIATYRTESINLFKDTVYLRSFYKDTTRLSETFYMVTEKEINPLNLKSKTVAYVYLRGVDGYAYFSISNQKHEARITLYGYYKTPCVIDSFGEVRGQLSGITLGETRTLASLKKREELFSTFESEFLSELGDYERKEAQGWAAIVNHHLCKTPLPFLLAPIALIICIYSLYETIIQKRDSLVELN